MKKLTFTLFTLILAASVHAQILGYNLNDTVSDFTVTDIEGNSHSLYDFTSQGKYVFLDFFFVDCGACQQTVRHFNALFDKYGCGAGDIVCISIDSGEDNDEEVANFEETYGGDTHHAIAISGDGGSAAVNNVFNPQAYPTYCLINPDNQIIELDIWPVYGVGDFEDVFPAGFNPEPMDCTVGTVAWESFHFDIYPNPTFDGTFHVTIDGEATLYVTDILGKTLFSRSIQGTQMIKTDLNAGTYFIKVQNDTGVHVKKLIIK